MYSLHYCIFRTAFSSFRSKFFLTLLTNLTDEQARKQMKTKIIVEFKPNCVNSSVFTISKYIAFFNYTATYFLQLLIMNYWIIELLNYWIILKIIQNVLPKLGTWILDLWNPHIMRVELIGSSNLNNKIKGNASRYLVLYSHVREVFVFLGHN